MNIKVRLRISRPVKKFLNEDWLNQVATETNAGDVSFESEIGHQIIEKTLLYRAGYHGIGLYLNIDFDTNETNSIKNYELRPRKSLPILMSQTDKIWDEIECGEYNKKNTGLSVNLIKSVNIGKIREGLTPDIYYLLEGGVAGEISGSGEKHINLFSPHCEISEVAKDKNDQPIFLLSPKSILPHIYRDKSVVDYNGLGSLSQRGLLAYEEDISKISIGRISDPICPVLRNPGSIVNKDFKDRLILNGADAEFIPVLSAGSRLYHIYQEKFQILLNIVTQAKKGKRLRIHLEQ